MREAVTQTSPAGFLAPGSSPSPAAFPSPLGDSGSVAGGSPVTVALPQRIHTAFPLAPPYWKSTGEAPSIDTAAIVRAHAAAVNTRRPDEPTQAASRRFAPAPGDLTYAAGRSIASSGTT